MKAWFSVAAGAADTLVLTERSEPEPGEGQVRLRVRACSINYPDVLVIEDRYQFKPQRPFAPGAEMSGVIDALGPGVGGFDVGDRVMAVGLCGGLAEYAVMSAAACHRIPDSMPYEEAAAFLMAFGTSHHALKDRAALRPGERLVVLGAAGGVGLAAVRLGRAMGARVVAAVSSDEKARVAREHGADETLVYPVGELDGAAARALTGAIREAAGGEVDVVYDGVGGAYSEPALRALGWNGRFLVVGFPAGIARIPLNLPLLKGCQIVGVFWGSFTERFPEAHCANVGELLEWHREGRLGSLVTDVVPFDRAPEAIAALAARRAQGKLVVAIG